MPYVAGRNAVVEAIRARQRVRRVLLDASTRENDASLRSVVETAAQAGIPVERVSRARLDEIHPRHQGVAAEVAPFSYTPFSGLVERVQADGASALVLALDELQDPQNLGSLLRTALAV